MAYLEILSKLAPILSSLIAFIAAIFISRQIANIRRNREVDTLFKIISLSDTDNMRAAKDWVVYESHRYPSAQHLKCDKTALKRFSDVVHLFGTMGVLVSGGYIPEKLIFDKYAMLMVGTWNRLQSLICGMRTDLRSLEYAENFELLVSRYDEWAKNNPLKTAEGERLKLIDGSLYETYFGGRNHEPISRIGERGTIDAGGATSSKGSSEA
jgi:hypothetical protein